MGLDVSHNCWQGSYTSFHEFRLALCDAIGIEFDRPDCEHYDGQWDELPKEPLEILIDHSDCDGHIHPREAAVLRDRLREIIPLLKDEWVVRKAIQFADGLDLAVDMGEIVDFY